MKKLFLIRHAHAEKFSESSRDLDRKLTAEGMKIASLVGKYLKDEEIKADAIICSSAQRAQLTAELVASFLDFNLESIQPVEELYEASARSFFDFVTRLDTAFRTVLIIGHNPTITYVADYLCDTEVNRMSPGAVIQLNFAVDSWSDLVKGQGEFINYYDIPLGA